jgi:hypothetical protein
MIRAAAFFAATALLAGCASVDTSGYPSLERRVVEARLNPVAGPAPAPAPPPVTAGFAQALGALSTDAARGEAAFRGALPGAERTIAAARGTALASEPWFAAQAALSALEATRAPTLLALAEIDRLLLEAELAGDANRAVPLGALARDVAAQESQQTATLNRLSGLLAN